MIKEVSALTPLDLRQYPVWEYVFDLDRVPECDQDMPTDTSVTPVKELPVDDTGNCVIGTKVKLNNGTQEWAMLSGLTLPSPDGRTGTVFVHLFDQKRAEWADFPPRDYPVYRADAPREVSALLGLAMEDVFPLSYDIRGLVAGPEQMLQGTIGSDGTMTALSAIRNESVSMEAEREIAVKDLKRRGLWKQDPLSLIGLLYKVGSFHVGVQGFYTLAQENTTLPSHAHVIRPLLDRARQMRVYHTVSSSEELRKDMASIGTLVGSYFEIDLAKEVLRGHERLWNAQCWRRGSIVIAALIGDRELGGVLSCCSEPGVASSIYQLRKVNPASALSYAQDVAKRGLIAFVFPASNGIESMDVFPPAEDLERLYRLSVARCRSLD